MAVGVLPEPSLLLLTLTPGHLSAAAVEQSRFDVGSSDNLAHSPIELNGAFTRISAEASSPVIGRVASLSGWLVHTRGTIYSSWASTQIEASLLMFRMYGGVGWLGTAGCRSDLTALLLTWATWRHWQAPSPRYIFRLLTAG
jgi:hypothetical protein